jgi:putative transposase
VPYYERNLPHWHPEGKPLFLTWRLHGSLPVTALRALRESPESVSGKKFVRFDRELDYAHFGPVWQKDPRVAPIVTNAITDAARKDLCTVHAYVVMPNHVHMLVEAKANVKEITRAIKGSSARACNQILNRIGAPFWQEESYDHWVRTPESFGKIYSYIAFNPVTARLVKKPEDWPWSSAHKGYNP